MLRLRQVKDVLPVVKLALVAEHVCLVCVCAVLRCICT